MGGLQTGYPGLKYMADQIVEYFPNHISMYLEPLAGLGRTAKYVKANHTILNDMSDYAYDYLTSKFREYEITKMDFIDAIKRFDSKDTFMFLDPPWSKTDYVNNPKTYCDRGVGKYYSDFFELVPKIKGDWIIAGRALGGARSTLSKYEKQFYSVILENPRKKINGFNAKVKLVSNKPIKIQNPRIIPLCITIDRNGSP